jgi:hypothetical protein
MQGRTEFTLGHCWINNLEKTIYFFTVFPKGSFCEGTKSVKDFFEIECMLTHPYP